MVATVQHFNAIAYNSSLLCSHTVSAIPALPTTSLAPLLLQISIAGRDNFLAVEADQALAAVVERAGEAKVAAVLLGCLTSCKAADMRAKAAMHLDACVQLHGEGLVSLPACERLRLVGCSGIVSTWQVHCVWRNEETAAGPSLPPVCLSSALPTNLLRISRRCRHLLLRCR